MVQIYKKMKKKGDKFMFKKISNYLNSKATKFDLIALLIILLFYVCWNNFCNSIDIKGYIIPICRYLYIEENVRLHNYSDYSEKVYNNIYNQIEEYEECIKSK